MSNRWKMNRIGFVNFWLYDEEEFLFSDGKLLLRGANASGKSITTQSFIPFILDGDRTPARLDPFGSGDRKMEYYFLGNGEKEDVTGYLFLEFRKEGTDQYRTIGVGQRAQKGKPMDFWGFLILDGRRVGYDVQLYKTAGSKKIPFAKQDLKKELGEDNPVVEKQKEYMGLVNKHVFGFPRLEQYDQFIRLMIKVRAPKLSKDFKPTKVYEILNESLQSLSDEDLRAMVDAMEKMDDIQSKLDGLKAALKDASSIRTEYGHYNRYMLAKKAEAYLELEKQVETINARLHAIRDEVKHKTEEKSRKGLEISNLSTEIEILEKEKERLSDGKLESYIERLENSNRQKLTLETEYAEFSRRIESSREKIREHEADLRQYEKEEKNYRDEMDHILEEMDQINETLQYTGHAQINEAIGVETISNEAIRTKTISNEKIGREERQIIWNQENKQLKELSDAISKGLSALQELGRVEQEWSKAEEECNQLNIQKGICQEQVSVAEGMETQCRDDSTEAFYGIAQANKFLTIEKPQLMELVSLISKYEGAQDRGEIYQIIDKIKSSRESLLWKKDASLRARREELFSKRKLAEQELKAIESQGEMIPARKEKVVKSRIVLEQKGIPWMPFYKAVEFSDNLSKNEQALLEEQLLDAGLLDALIVPQKDYTRAKRELGSLSDSLIQLDSNICTGYNRLIPGEVNPELLDAVKLAIDNIYDHDEKGAKLVLAQDGYYKNGIMEGHSMPEEEASFVGIVARRNRLAKMIAEKEAQIDELKQNIQECDLEIQSVGDSLEGLAGEYRGIPDFQDLDHAIHMLRDALYDLDRATQAYNQKSEELSQILKRKKEWEQKVMTTCKGLPYDRTRTAYEEALESAGSYQDDLKELERAVNYLNSAKMKSVSISALVEKEEETMDHADEQSRKVRRQLKICLAEIQQIEEFLNQPENIERAAKLEQVTKALLEKNAKIVSNREIIAGLEANISIRSGEIEGLTETASKTLEQENIKKAYFQEEMSLELVMEQGNKTARESAKEATGYIREQDKFKEVGDVVGSLYRVYQQHNSNLTSYGTSLENCFDDAGDSGHLRKRQIIVSTWQGRKLQLEEFYKILKEAIESTELLIQEKDRALFEDILADTLSRKLSNRISESRSWIADMSNLMQQMDTSMGLTFSLDWKPCAAEGEQELDARELEKLLSRDRALLTHEDIEKVSGHFRSKIRMAKQMAEDSGQTVNYGDMVRDALDYRKWFEFRMNFYRGDGQKRELTNSAFNRFSGGEKAMAMYVPLFAAVNAQYKKSENKTHPRMVALDEAFAGVDDKNISTMFELVQKLDFDYIMNSQALWGCYETVKSLKIAELLRPANSDVVTVISYYWNGKERVLDEQ